jgi:hypothetical protein
LLEGGLGHAIQLLDRLGLTPSQEDLATITPREVSSTGPLVITRIIKAKQESRKTINRVRGKEECGWIKKTGTGEQERARNRK